MFEREKTFDTMEIIVNEYFKKHDKIPLTGEQINKLAYECYYAYVNTPENTKEVARRILKLIEQTLDNNG